MSRLNPTPSQIRYRAKQKLKKQQRREQARVAAETRKAACPSHHANTAPWDCGCTYGCDCCDIHSRCSDCGEAFR